MQESVIDIEKKVVRVGFERPLNPDENKEDLYKIVMESRDIFAVLEHALGLGYVPETFRQTMHSGSDAHLRFKLVNNDNQNYARMISLRVDKDILYRLYVPQS